MIANSTYGGRTIGYTGSPFRRSVSMFPPRTDGLHHDVWLSHEGAGFTADTVTAASGTTYGFVTFTLVDGTGYYYAYDDVLIGTGGYTSQGFPVNYTGEWFNFVTRWTLNSKITPSNLAAWFDSH